MAATPPSTEDGGALAKISIRRQWDGELPHSPLTHGFRLVEQLLLGARKFSFEL